MKKTWAIMRRDLLKLSRNPLTIFTSVLMPIVYLIIFGNSFQGVLKNLPLAVVVQDRGRWGLRVMERMQALAAGPKTIRVTYMDNPGEAIGAVRNGRFKGAVIVPPDFSRKIAQGRIGEIGLFTDNVDTVSALTLETTIREATASLRTSFVSARQTKLHAITVRPSSLFVTVDYDRSLIPGVVVMALFMGSLTSGLFNWVMDRFMGITECYLVTPLSRWNLAGGVLGSSVLVTSCASIIVLIAGLLITGGTVVGGLPAFLLLLGVILLGGTGILAMTFTMLARAQNPRLVGAAAGFLNVILFFPSGAVYPVESFPPWLRAFARYNPETHVVRALKSILFKGANVGAITNDILFLVAFTAVMLVLASATLKRTL